MKSLICEMCGSNGLIKQDGMYVCQSCGTKYSVEEAKKMMVEGTVKIDNSEKLQNYYTIARQARESNDAENAAKYYDLIKQEDPNSWEASFYNVYFRAIQTNSTNVKSAPNSITNCLETVFKLIKNGTDSDEEKKKHAQEVGVRVRYICYMFEQSAKSTFCDSLNSTYGKYANNREILVTLAVAYGSFVMEVADAMFKCGDLIERDYSDDNTMIVENACALWKPAIDIWKEAYCINDNHAAWYSKMKSTYVAKIKKYDRSYSFDAPKYVGFPSPYINATKPRSDSDFGVSNSSRTNSGYSGGSSSGGSSSGGSYSGGSSSSGGCYVATAVYGSYDCPQVWTLRRYRDYTLAETWYGRAFIHTYYAISPTLVKWFGHTEWFKKMWKGKLDRMVEHLHAEGVEDTPYEDRNW